MYATQDRLDVIINNACQTVTECAELSSAHDAQVRRPVGYYKHLISEELTCLAGDAPPQVQYRCTDIIITLSTATTTER